MTNEVLGCLWLWETATDYQLCEWDITILPTLYKQDNIRYEYNQANQDWSKVSCTIFAAVWMLSDLMNYEFSIEEIKEIDDLSYNNPKYHNRERNQGWYVKDAVDLVADWRNERHSDNKVAYYRVSKYSNIVDEILWKWYDLDTNYCPTVEYAKDYYLDWVLNWYEFWTKTNWHSVCVIYDWVRKIKDNYKGRKTPNWKNANIYEIKYPVSNITNYWPYLYLYTKVSENNLEELKRLNEFKAILLTTIENNSLLWHKTNDKNYRNQLNKMNITNRQKIKDIDKQLSLLH